MNDLGKISFKLCGEYDPDTTYEKLDVVSYEFGSYAAKGITTGNLPTDENYWFPMATGASNGASNQNNSIIFSDTEPEDQEDDGIWMQPYETIEVED